MFGKDEVKRVAETILYINIAVNIAALAALYDQNFFDNMERQDQHDNQRLINDRLDYLEEQLAEIKKLLGG